MKTVKALKITCIAEDTSPWLPYWGAHGLSMLLEIDGKRLLFDAGGDGKVLTHNIEKLGIDITTIDYFVLSHTHDDHSGGLYTISDQIVAKPMFCTTDAFSDEMPKNTELENKMIDIHRNIETIEISPGVLVLGEKDSVQPKYPVKEISLVINLEGKGLVVILGCSHPGIMNILKSIKSQYDLPIYGIVGGLHLKDSAEREIQQVASFLKMQNVKIILANHCTGFNALKEISSQLPDATELIGQTVTGSFHSGKEYVF